MIEEEQASKHLETAGESERARKREKEERQAEGGRQN